MSEQPGTSVNEQLWRAVEKGNEDATRYLLKKRADPNYTRTYKDLMGFEHKNTSLLMVASHKGYKSILRLLFESGAKVNSSNNDGRTALHWAALSGHNEKALDLIKMMADVDAVDGDGRTALHYAALSGHHETALDLIKMMANVNAVDRIGQTPLHLAALDGNDTTVLILIKNMADPNIQDKDGNTPLHNAAKCVWARVIDVLLKSKADADCRNKEGKWPYQLAEDGQLKRILQEARVAVLYAAGTVKPKVMKLCVIGAAGAGKTTLLATLKRGLFRSLFTIENQPDDPTCEFERTVGINVMTVDIPGVGRFSLFDYAGQEHFHKTHGFFFPAANSFFILLISLVTGEERQPCTLEELIHLAQYWLSFLRASLDKHIIPTVVIAASRADCCPNGQQLLQQVVCHLSDVFKGKINILEEYFLLDCRKSWSPEMKKLRRFLKQVRDQFMQQSDVRYPRLYEPVTSQLLPALRMRQQNPFMEEEELVSAIEREYPSQDKQVIHKVVDFLNDSGEIIKVNNVVCLSPVWLCGYTLGPLMAPKEMRYHAKAPNGKMTREEAERAINQYLRDLKIKVNINIDKIFKLLQDLGVIFRLTDGTYMFPTHLPPKMLSEMWRRMDEVKVYVGRRCFCSSPTSIFNPSTFVLFQCQVSVNLDIKSLLWRDGIVVARARKSHVQCLAVMVDCLQAVDFVARGKEGSESECLSLLHDVMKEWTDVVEKHSPGTEYEMAYLSRKHLTEHKDRPAVYSQEEVDKATSKGPFAFVTILTHLQDVEPDVLPVLSSKDEVSLSPAFDLSSSLQRSASLHPVLTSRWTSHGRPLETPDCMFGSEREIEYSVFGKRVECNKWVIAIHITNGSMGVYEALASKRRNHRYIELKLPGRDYIKSDGKIWLHIMCKKPWQLCQGKRSVSLNTKTIWRSDTHSSCYHEFEVEDCQRSARTLRCTIATFFEDKDKNISPSVQLVISKPVVETCQPSSKRAAREESADTLEGTIGDSSQPLHKGDQCVTFEHIAVVARCCSDKWRAFGRVLLHCGNTEVLNAVSGLSSTDTDYERLYCIIEKWKKKGEEATVGQLVEASGHFSVNCQGDVKQELKKAGLL